MLSLVWVPRLNQAQPNVLGSCSSCLTVVMAPEHGTIPLWSSPALHFPEIAHFHIFKSGATQVQGAVAVIWVSTATPPPPPLPPAPNPRFGTALQTLNMNEQWEKEAFATVGGN